LFLFDSQGDLAFSFPLARPYMPLTPGATSVFVIRTYPRHPFFSFFFSFSPTGHSPSKCHRPAGLGSVRYCFFLLRVFPLHPIAVFSPLFLENFFSDFPCNAFPPPTTFPFCLPSFFHALRCCLYLERPSGLALLLSERFIFPFFTYEKSSVPFTAGGGPDFVRLYASFSVIRFTRYSLWSASDVRFF